MHAPRHREDRLHRRYLHGQAHHEPRERHRETRRSGTGRQQRLHRAARTPTWTAAVEGAIFGCFFNTGQVCAASSRLFVHESLYDEFVEKFVEGAKALRAGRSHGPDDRDRPGSLRRATRQDRGLRGVGRRSGRHSAARRAAVPILPRLQDGYFVLPTIFGDADNARSSCSTRSSARWWASASSGRPTKPWPSPTAPGTGCRPRSGRSDLRQGLAMSQSTRSRHRLAERTPDAVLRDALGWLQGVRLRQGPQHHGARGVRAHQAHLRRSSPVPRSSRGTASSSGLEPADRTRLEEDGVTVEPRWDAGDDGRETGRDLRGMTPARWSAGQPGETVRRAPPRERVEAGVTGGSSR